MSPRASQPARAPVLYPAPLPDAGAARQRLGAEGGELVLHSGGGAEVLAGAGTVRTAHLAPGGSRVGRHRLPADVLPWVVLDIAGAAPVALPVGGWVPAVLSTAEQGLGRAGDVDLLEVTGIRALLKAVGVADADVFDLEEAPPEVLHTLRSPRLVDPRAAGQAGTRVIAVVIKAVAVVSVVALAAHGVVRGLADGNFRPDVPWPPLALVVGISAALLGVAVRSRVGTARGERAPDPVPGSVEVVRLGGGQTVVGRDASGDLMVVEGGLIAWLPGPARGGANKAAALAARGETLLVTLTTADGIPLAELPGADAATTARLRALLSDCGVEWTEHRAPRDAPAANRGGHPSIGPVDDQWRELCLLVALLAGLTGLIAAGNAVWAVVVAAVVVVGFALVVRGGRP